MAQNSRSTSAGADSPAENGLRTEIALRCLLGGLLSPPPVLRAVPGVTRGVRGKNCSKVPFRLPMLTSEWLEAEKTCVEGIAGVERDVCEV